MKKITIKEFAGQAIKLKPGDLLRFSITNEDFRTMEYVISLVRLANSYCLFANCDGGGRPLVIDVTIYDESLINICDTLDKYINGDSGNYGYVEIIEDSLEAAQDNPDWHMLISVMERKITTAVFPSHAKAYERMKQELDKTTADRQESDELDGEYGIDTNSAWSNVNHNEISDWLIVKITEEKI